MTGPVSTLCDDWFLSGTEPGEGDQRSAADARTAQFYRTLLNHGFDVCVVVDRSERVSFCSRSIREVLGYEPDLLVGRELLSLVHADDRAAHRTALARAGDYPVSVVCRLRHADGGWRSLESSVFALIAPDGASVRVVTSRDVTALTQMEARHWRDDRIVTLGQMAATVAHDFNTLLHAVALHLQFLEEETPRGLRDATRQVRSMLDGASELTGQLLTFARGDQPGPASTPVDVHAVINEVGALLRTLVRRSIRIVYALNANVAWVGLGRVPLTQLLLNLVVNARDAMPRGGLLTIATYQTPPEALPAINDVRAGTWLTIEIADVGCGMAPHVKARMFDPFFTTKTRGQGGGLGLHTVMNIVTRSGGTIAVDSVVGEGTTVRIHLPLSIPVGMESDGIA